jgi:hypothetical protein
LLAYLHMQRSLDLRHQGCTNTNQWLTTRQSLTARSKEVDPSPDLRRPRHYAFQASVHQQSRPRYLRYNQQEAATLAGNQAGSYSCHSKSSC